MNGAALRLCLHGLGAALLAASTLGPPGGESGREAVAGACVDDAFEPDDTRETARLLGVNEVQHHALCDPDWSQFYVSSSGIYVMETKNLTGGADTVLGITELTQCLSSEEIDGSHFCTLFLYEETASDDDSGGGRASRLVYRGGHHADVVVREAGESYANGKGYDIELRRLDLEDTHFVPAAVHATGRGGALFRTDLSLFASAPFFAASGADGAVTALLVFTPAGPDGAAARIERSVTVPAGHTLTFEDVLPSLFGVARGSGGIEIRGRVVAHARTYAAGPPANRGESVAVQRLDESGGRTPGIDFDSGGIPYRRDEGTYDLHLLGLRGGADFRSNVALRETTGGPVRVVAGLHDRNGALLGERPVDLPPYGGAQINDVFAELGVPPQEDARMSLRAASPTGLFIAYGTVIDNQTSDFLYLPAEIASDRPDRFLPVIDDADDGRTDLRVLNVDPFPRSVGVKFLSAEGRDPVSSEYRIGGGETLVVDDVVNRLGSAGPGALVVTGGGRLVVSGRTYTARAGGTSGHTIRPLPPVGFGYFGSARPVLLLGAGPASSKVSLGLVRVAPSPTTVITVYAYSAEGRALGAASFTLDASDQVRVVRDVLGEIGAARVECKRLELEVTNEPNPDEADFRYIAAFAVDGDPDGGDSVIVPVEGLSESHGSVVTLPGRLLNVVRVPGGTYRIGSPVSERGRDADEAQHRVTLSRPVELGVTEVTEAEWNAVMGRPGGSDLPVVGVSWNDVAGPGGFLERLNRYVEATGQARPGPFRLPTESEWEVAARAGTSTRFSFGDRLELDDACEREPLRSGFVARLERMWWCGNSLLAGGGPKPVGDYSYVDPDGVPASVLSSNGNGLRDMHGNVWEWTSDWYAPFDTAPLKDPQGPPSGTTKVIRGGGWNSPARLCRSANRFGYPPDGRFDHVGFRVARSID